MPSTFIVTVDTEEEGLWGGNYAPAGNTVANIQRLAPFQQLCDQFGIRPTYLIDAPVVQDAQAVSVLREFHEPGRCEIGAHLHPWCTPPLSEPSSGRFTYQCNLSHQVQHDKLTWLTREIERAFGQRPTSFRAGRYGLDITGARILEQLGYLADSSVIPFTDYSRFGGPDFSSAPFRPYFIGGDDLRTPFRSGKLVEIPVSVGFNRLNFHSASRWHRRSRQTPFKQLKLEGILDRTGLLRRIKLSPEQADGHRLIELTDTFIAQGAPALVMMFHSSSLLPGKSPYVKDEHALTGFLDRMKQLFEHVVTRNSLRTATLTEFASDFRNQAAASPSDSRVFLRIPKPAPQHSDSIVATQNSRIEVSS